MKKLLSIFAPLLCAAIVRADIITATITITNTPVYNNSFTINGTTVTWTNSVSTPSTQVLTTNTIGASTTNMLAQIATYRPGGSSVNVSYNGTNGVILTGPATMTVSVSAGISTPWATLTLSTNTSGGQTLVVPATVYPAAQRTNVWSLAAKAISDYSTNAIDQNAAAVSQLLGLTNDQTITGAKTFSNPSNSFTGNGAGLTNNSGSHFAPTNTPMLFSPTVVGSTVLFTNSGNTVTLTLSGNSSLGGVSRDITCSPAGLVIGTVQFSATDGIEGNAGLFLTGLNATNLVGFVQDTNIGGTYSTYAVTLSNPTNAYTGHASLNGTNTLSGILTVPASLNSSLVNSNNVLSAGTNSYLQLSGPTGSFYIAAINGGIDGRIITLENTTAQIMVIGNQSGYDTSTSTNRILTMTGADRVISNNIVSLRYDGSASRWKIISVN